MLAVALAFTCTVAGAQGASQDEKKFDKRLRDEINAASDDAPIKVIVTVKPGARRGLLQKLKAHGATVSADFTIIEAVAAELPPGLLRSLASDKDVIAISTDADVVSDGIATAVSGTSQSSAYSLRSTLGLQSAGATTFTEAFRVVNT